MSAGLRLICILFVSALAGSAPAAAQAQGADSQRADSAAAGYRPEWEIGFHGAWAINGSQTSGVGTLPPTGELVSGQASLTSFYFGTGAQLFNQIVTGSSGGAAVPTIVPLDAVLQSATFARQRHTAALGIRLARSINARLGWEFTVDVSRPDLVLTGAALSGIEATRASFIPALQHALGASAQPSVTSTATGSPTRTSLALATGALTVNLRRGGRAVPYIAAGGGIAVLSGEAPGVTLIGTYRFGSSSTVQGTDSVALRYALHSPAPAGVAGGGIKYMVSRRMGLRFDGRVYAYQNSVTGVVDASPAIAVATTGDPLPIVRGSALQFSATAPLTGSQITGARVFSDSGWQTHVNMSAGVFWRF